MTDTKNQACQACMDRAQDWAIQYSENWHGPKQKWSKKQRDSYYETLAIVTLFAKGFCFDSDSTAQK